jgi:flagellin
MSDITLSKAVRSNLLSLQNTADLMSSTQNRLATGKKVNSALDNPSNFFTASSLNSRAGDINALMDGMANGIQTLEAADNGLKAITKTLESMQSTLRQARQDKSFETVSIEAADLADLDGLSLSGGATGEGIVIDFEGAIDTGEVDGDGASVMRDAESVDDMVKVINSEANGAVRASNDNGKLRIENLSTDTLVVTDGADDDPATLATIEGNSVRAGLAEQYNELRDQLDKLVDDASFNGINLLRGDDLKITFNEIGTSDLEIKSKIGDEENVTLNSATLGLQTNMEAADFDSDQGIDDFLADVKGAINTVRSQASAFGSSLSIVQNRQDFSKNMINTLQTGAANLTLADSNEEAANLLALQTRQQLSSTALSMASQADQAVLRLF